MPRRSTGLRRRGKNWHGRWVEDGREREKSFGPNLAIARRCLDETRRNARLRAVGMGAELAQVAALAPLVEAYLAAKAPRWRPEYLRVVKAALAEMLDGIDRVADLTAGRVEAARDRLEGANRTKNKKAGWVLGFARWLRQSGRGNPPLLELGMLPRADRIVRRAMSRDEVARLVEHGGDLADLIALLAGTGLRLEEALRLRWRDVGPGGLHVSRSKNGESRTVPIADGLRSRLGALKLSRGADDDGAVLLSPRGHPMTGRGSGGRLLARLREALTAAGVSPVGVDYHALRHTYATWAASAGATTQQLRALLGWKSAAMADRYVHREGIDLAGLVQRIGQGPGSDSENRAKSAENA